VTAWEIMKKTSKPYKGHKGSEVVKILEQGARLDYPGEGCPPKLYVLMRKVGRSVHGSCSIAPRFETATRPLAMLRGHRPILPSP